MPRAKKSSELPIICVPADGVQKAGLDAPTRKWAKDNDFTGQSGKLLPLPGAKGERAGYLFGMGETKEQGSLITGAASAALPAGTYRLEGAVGNADMAALGFLLGTYSFDRFKNPTEKAQLSAVADADLTEAKRLADAAFLTRDLINTPSNLLGPEAFEKEIRAFARARKMTAKAIVGDNLLKQNFPMVHTVGRASAEAPRLMDLSWGAKSHPKVTLVGKGVTFDTGGLDLKPPTGMALMKKDMGGAANVLGLAHAIIDAKLKVRLRVIIPVVENAVSGNAFRPGDVLTARNGLTVEIGNTDAEGRLILADALALADEESPDILIDMATLTGAARISVGRELGALFTNDDNFAQQAYAAGLAVDDPLWRMPLWPGYDRLISSPIADVNHISQGPHGGAITAALFLQRFVKNAKSWSHLDIFAWSADARPGRTVGGADTGLRAVYKVLKARFS